MKYIKYFIIGCLPLLSVLVYAEEKCTDIVPRISIVKSTEDGLKKLVTLPKIIKKIFTTIDTNGAVCFNNKYVDIYYKAILKHFEEKYYIDPEIILDIVIEKDIEYADFIIKFQEINKVNFTGSTNIKFFNTINNISKGDQFITKLFLQNNRIFSNLYSLNITDINIQTSKDNKDEGLDIIYKIDQNKIWSGSIELSNSQSSAYKSYKNLLSTLSFNLENPYGLAWKHSIIASSSKLHSDSNSYTQFFSYNVKIPFKSLLIDINTSSNVYNISERSIQDSLIQNSFFTGTQNNTSLNVEYNALLNSKWSANIFVGIRQNTYKDFSQINIESSLENGKYVFIKSGIYIEFNNERVSFSARIYYDQLSPSLSDIENKEINGLIGVNYKNNYKINGYSISGYISLSDSISYSLYLSGQNTKEILRDAHKFQIGDRGSVRGFGDNYSLSSDNGFFVRNELSVNINQYFSPYIAYDYAKINPTLEGLINSSKASISGSAIGFKGYFKDIEYDSFFAIPISNIDSINIDKVSFGFTTTYSF